MLALQLRQILDSDGQTSRLKSLKCYVPAGRRLELHLHLAYLPIGQSIAQSKNWPRDEDENAEIVVWDVLEESVFLVHADLTMEVWEFNLLLEERC